MWKDYTERDNERIAKWNVRAREVCKREIRSKIVAAKQRVLEDIWFKPYFGKFSKKEFVEEYVQKRHTS